MENPTCDFTDWHKTRTLMFMMFIQKFNIKTNDVYSEDTANEAALICKLKPRFHVVQRRGY